MAKSEQHGSLEEQPAIPGTVHLVDLEGIMQSRHASGTNSHDIVLVPAPSSDPDDPLNWTSHRKLLSTVCMCVYTLMVGIASAAIYSVLEPISRDTGLTLNNLNNGTGYMFLFFGWGCLVWQPLAIQYGKRPVYLFSILATCAIQAWAPYTTSNGQWIANKILQGFFGAPIESLCEISVTDIVSYAFRSVSRQIIDVMQYFQHERGKYLALYGLLLAGSNFFAPIIAGFIADGQGWQWVLYWCAIFCAMGFVFLFFFMEETNYPNRVPTTTSNVALSVTTSLDPRPLEEGDDQKENPMEPTEDNLEAGSGTVHNPRKDYLQKLSLWQTRDLAQPNRLLTMALRPLILLVTFPVIAYAGFSYGSSLIWFNVLNGTASLVLASPPYSFRPSSVGLAYISPLLGTAVGAAYTGLLGDRFILHRARRNAGILEAEHRLWLFLPSIVLLPFGLVLWGVGAAHAVHWFGVVFAMGVIAFTNVVGLQLSVSYAVDAYRALGAEAVVTVILVRNTMSFAIGYGISPWIEGLGLQNAFVVAAMVGMVQVCSFLVFVRWGKTLRERSVSRYEKMLEGALVH